MGRRFSDISNGDKLATYKKNYEEYKRTQAQKSLKERGRVPVNMLPVRVTVLPFGHVSGGDAKGKVAAQRYICRMKKASFDAAYPAKTEVSKYYKAFTAADNNATPPTGFRPARVNIFRCTNTTPEYEDSKFTKASYIKRSGERFSIPFGATDANKSQDDVISDITEAGLAAIANAPYSRVSVQPERYR